MNKKQIRKFLGNNGERTAKYVVAHFYAQGKKKRPSLAYKGEKNPQKALKLAMSELEKINPYEHGGQRIDWLIRMMIENAKITRRKVYMVFNGLPLYASADSTVDSVMALQKKLWRERREAYLNSLE